MQVRQLALTSVLVSASWLALGVSTPALALCDSYSGGCAPTAPPVGAPIAGGTDAPATGGGGTDAPTTGEQPTGPGAPVDGGTDAPATGGDTQAPTFGSGTLSGGTQQPATGAQGAATATSPAGGAAPTAATLPFTGGELVLLTAAGVAALAGGTALVVAGRRRTQTA